MSFINWCKSLPGHRPEYIRKRRLDILREKNQNYSIEMYSSWSRQAFKFMFQNWMLQLNWATLAQLIVVWNSQLDVREPTPYFVQLWTIAALIKLTQTPNLLQRMASRLPCLIKYWEFEVNLPILTSLLRPTLDNRSSDKTDTNPKSTPEDDLPDNTIPIRYWKKHIKEGVKIQRFILCHKCNLKFKYNLCSIKQILIRTEKPHQNMQKAKRIFWGKEIKHKINWKKCIWEKVLMERLNKFKEILD